MKYRRELIRIREVKEGDDKVTLMPKVETELVDLKRVLLVICTNLPAEAGEKRVVVSIGGTEIPLHSLTGHYVKTNQLSSRRAYPVIYGDFPVHFTIETRIKRVV